MKFLQSSFFYLLLWMRRLVVGIGQMVAGFFLMATIVTGIACFFMQPEKRMWGLVVLSGVSGFGIFLLCQFYDQILIKLNPTDNDLILKQ